MNNETIDRLIQVAHEQAATVQRAVDDWWDAKRAGEPEPGRIYGRRMVTASWELHETAERVRDESRGSVEQHGAVTTLLREYRDGLGGLTRNDLWFAARAVSHRADAVAGGQTANYFGGAPVDSSTSMQQMYVASVGDPVDDLSDVHEEYAVEDVAITFVGRDPSRAVTIQGAAARRDAAARLVAGLTARLGGAG